MLAENRKSRQICARVSNLRRFCGRSSRRATFHGLIVIGKDMNLSPRERDRLKWRLGRTMIDSNAISCVSFNGLCDDLDYWLETYHRV
ncbi:Shedu anti-phage system protein SduA domain-containing protein [Synechococcus sp. PCC 7336]|uniref:Shedu anti-phage system protein SduA domain-containing protein n=1 Tax=Synechococcus sp. PCC 7336 TaxID=195250 RepID=UPI001D0D1ECF